jgi:hypothetical protein
MTQKVPRFSFSAFQPYWTHNLMRDGSGVYVHDRAQLRELCRRQGVKAIDPIAPAEVMRADPREILTAVQEEERAFPKRYRRLKEQVKTLTAQEANKLAERAAYTKFETVRP